MTVMFVVTTTETMEPPVLVVLVTIVGTVWTICELVKVWTTLDVPVK